MSECSLCFVVEETNVLLRAEAGLVPAVEEDVAVLVHRGRNACRPGWVVTIFGKDQVTESKCLRVFSRSGSEPRLELEARAFFQARSK